MKKIFRKGFTLAELIVTLGIIGIISVIMFSIANNSKPDEDKAMYLKAYNGLKTVTKNLVNNSNAYSLEPTDLEEHKSGKTTDTDNWDYKTQFYADKYPLLDNREDTSGFKCDGKNKYGCLLSKSMDAVPGTKIEKGNTVSYDTKNGMKWTVTQKKFKLPEFNENSSIYEGAEFLAVVKVKSNPKNDKEYTFNITADGKVKPTGEGAKYASSGISWLKGGSSDDSTGSGSGDGTTDDGTTGSGSDDDDSTGSGFDIKKRKTKIICDDPYKRWQDGEGCVCKENTPCIQKECVQKEPCKSNQKWSQVACTCVCDGDLGPLHKFDNMTDCNVICKNNNDLINNCKNIGGTIDDVNCSCNCPNSKIWNGTECVCPPDTYGDDCVPCDPPRQWIDNECKCPGGQVFDLGKCKCPITKPYWNGEECVNCTPPEYEWDKDNLACKCPSNTTLVNKQCVCPEDSPKWNGKKCVPCEDNKVWNGKDCVCPGYWEGDDCTKCGLDCNSKGENYKANNDCTDCVCGLDCKSQGTGANCSQGKEVKGDCESCGCPAGYKETERNDCYKCDNPNHIWNYDENKCTCPYHAEDSEIDPTTCEPIPPSDPCEDYKEHGCPSYQYWNGSKCVDKDDIEPNATLITCKMPFMCTYDIWKDAGSTTGAGGHRGGSGPLQGEDFGNMDQYLGSGKGQFGYKNSYITVYGVVNSLNKIDLYDYLTSEDDVCTKTRDKYDCNTKYDDCSAAYASCILHVVEQHESDQTKFYNNFNCYYDKDNQECTFEPYLDLLFYKDPCAATSAEPDESCPDPRMTIIDGKCDCGFKPGDGYEWADGTGTTSCDLVEKTCQSEQVVSCSANITKKIETLREHEDGTYETIIEDGTGSFKYSTTYSSSLSLIKATSTFKENIRQTYYDTTTETTPMYNNEKYTDYTSTTYTISDISCTCQPYETRELKVWSCHSGYCTGGLCILYIEAYDGDEAWVIYKRATNNSAGFTQQGCAEIDRSAINGDAMQYYIPYGTYN